MALYKGLQRYFQLLRCKEDSRCDRVVFLLNSRGRLDSTSPRSPPGPARVFASASDEGASMVSPHSQLLKVTQRVIERSKPTRAAYLARIDQAQGKFPARGALSKPAP